MLSSFSAIASPVRSLLIVASLSGCIDLRDLTGSARARDPGQTSSTTGEEPTEEELFQYARSPLPAVRNEIQSSGGEQAPDYSVCAWAGSVDRVVLGKLMSIRPVEKPLIVHTGVLDVPNWAWVDECDGPIASALELDIEVGTELLAEDSLVGLSPEGVVVGGPGQTLTVHLGMWQIDRWWPAPRRDEQGGLIWLGPSEDALVIGQTIGLPIHFIAHLGLWSLMGEPLFGTDEEGRVLFQPRSGEGGINNWSAPPAPVGAEGLDIETFAESIRVCMEDSVDAEAAAERRFLMRTFWGPGVEPDDELSYRPTQYVAAQCNAPLN